MGHTRPEDLKDLKGELEVIQALPGLKEKSPGIFYFKTIPFLHFHDKNGHRWADVKVQNNWVKVEIDFKAKKAARTVFLRTVKAAYAGISKDRI